MGTITSNKTKAKSLYAPCTINLNVSSNGSVQLLTSLFKGEGATTWSHESDLLEPCPRAIVSLLIFCWIEKASCSPLRLADV